MKIDAWWFENKQTENEILQPEFAVSKTHLGIYAELDELSYPFKISAVAKKKRRNLQQGI